MSLFSRNGPTTHQEIGRIMMCHAQKCLVLMSTRAPEKISAFFEFPWFDVLQQKMICHSTGIRNIWDVALPSLPWLQTFARMLMTDLSIYHNFENELKFECLTFCQCYGSFTSISKENAACRFHARRLFQSLVERYPACVANTRYTCEGN